MHKVGTRSSTNTFYYRHVRSNESGVLGFCCKIIILSKTVMIQICEARLCTTSALNYKLLSSINDMLILWKKKKTKQFRLSMLSITFFEQWFTFERFLMTKNHYILCARSILFGSMIYLFSIQKWFDSKISKIHFFDKLNDKNILIWNRQ